MMNYYKISFCPQPKSRGTVIVNIRYIEKISPLNGKTYICGHNYDYISARIQSLPTSKQLVMYGLTPLYHEKIVQRCISENVTGAIFYSLLNLTSAKSSLNVSREEWHVLASNSPVNICLDSIYEPNTHIICPDTKAAIRINPDTTYNYSKLVLKSIPVADVNCVGNVCLPNVLIVSEKFINIFKELGVPLDQYMLDNPLKIASTS
jgi:hypothetical protein